MLRILIERFFFSRRFKSTVNVDATKKSSLERCKTCSFSVIILRKRCDLYFSNQSSPRWYRVNVGRELASKVLNPIMSSRLNNFKTDFFMSSIFRGDKLPCINSSKRKSSQETFFFFFQTFFCEIAKRHFDVCFFYEKLKILLRRGQSEEQKLVFVNPAISASCPRVITS